MFWKRKKITFTMLPGINSAFKTHTLVYPVFRYPYPGLSCVSRSLVLLGNVRKRLGISRARGLSGDHPHAVDEIRGLFDDSATILDFRVFLDVLHSIAFWLG